MPGKTYRIAVIPGDGIGQEVMPCGLAALRAASARFGFTLSLTTFDFASCDYYDAHGKMMLDDWIEQLTPFDAIYFGVVGDPARHPDHVTLWGSLLQMRRHFDQYVNLRPCRLVKGVPSPLAEPGEIDFWIVRENTEGEYSEVGGKIFEGTEREVVIQETIMTRTGVDRILKYAFDLAATTRRKKLTSATKSNGIKITMPYWDSRFHLMAKQYPQVKTEQFHIDILSAHFVQKPSYFDVVVGSNLHGDILSDLGPAVTGTIGIAPSGNINPERKFPSLFEPVHGSAPDIMGKGIANPVGMIWAGQMMLLHLGEKDAADAMIQAIDTVLGQSDASVLTPDMKGKGTTQKLGDAIADAIATV
ncbi:probable Tartrate dehydrogenase [Sporisorium reilianum f. sp. reilianum]|uniref:D-malate dehydrogenase (decarboxylating) n=1 Tax=Sporisorium reilianum f. sp. reilianum TaxID=72559 RepID=A0A2N8U5V7_9BASI|nr:probable Tartrate dehydrogenase [Sporisorium reilianum f. sp. reilianum]